MQATPDTVIDTRLLYERPMRVRNAVLEEQVDAELELGMAGSPARLLQKLTDLAMKLCASHSAGVSLLEEAGGTRFFRWHAVSGEWRKFLGATLPREFSPCGTVLDRQEALLMVDPERYFTPLSQVPPRVEEVLLLPFAVHGEIVGTMWVVAHDSKRKFDLEDRRIVTRLTRFAAAAYEQLHSSEAAGDAAGVPQARLVSEPPRRAH